jgi:kelch-like protein 10
VAGDEASRPVITEVLTYLDELETMTTRDEEIPTPKFALQRVHDILFVVGGDGKNDRGIDCFECYSTRTDRWTKTEDVDRCWKQFQCAAVIGFDIYVIGGILDSRGFNSCRCFNAVTKTWRDVAPMNHVRFKHCVAVLGDVLYVMGGCGLNFSEIKTAERYDPKTDWWSPIADMNLQRIAASATALNSKIYVAGGKYCYRDFLRSAEVYDPRTNQWTLINDMRIGRVFFSCIAFHGCVYAIGGQTKIRPAVYDCMSSGEKYDPENDTWSPIPDMSMKRCYMATAVIDDKIFVIGGLGYMGDIIISVECFNDEENEWHKATGMSAARYQHEAVVVSGLPNVSDYIGRRKRQE